MTTSRRVPAPGLLEVAQAWWDVDREPSVTWSDDGRTFLLVDGDGDGEQAPASLLLARLAATPVDPRRLAEVLAEGLASCDFPPTGDGASPTHVRRTLAAAGCDAGLLADDA